MSTHKSRLKISSFPWQDGGGVRRGDYFPREKRTPEKSSVVHFRSKTTKSIPSSWSHWLFSNTSTSPGLPHKTGLTFFFNHCKNNIELCLPDASTLVILRYFYLILALRQQEPVPSGEPCTICQPFPLLPSSAQILVTSAWKVTYIRNKKMLQEHHLFHGQIQPVKQTLDILDSKQAVSLLAQWACIAKIRPEQQAMHWARKDAEELLINCVPSIPHAERGRGI